MAFLPKNERLTLEIELRFGNFLIRSIDGPLKHAQRPNLSPRDAYLVMCTSATSRLKIAYHFGYILIVSSVCIAGACIPDVTNQRPFVSELESKAGRVEDTSATHDFRIFNRELFPLVVTSIRKNCGCTTTPLVCGTIVNSKRELIVPVSLAARSTGGVEVGELWLELTSKSLESREVHLKFSAEFPRLVWTEIEWVSSARASKLRITLRTRIPGLLSKFQKISIKSDDAAIELVSGVPASDGMQFDFESDKVEQCGLREGMKFLALFEFDDQLVPNHSELVEIPRSSDCKFHSTMPIPSAVFSNDLNA